MQLVLPNPRNGVAWTAEMNFINAGTLPNLPPGFSNDLRFRMPGAMPVLPTTSNGMTASPAATGPYSGPFAGRRVLGEPFAVWLGLVLVLVAWKWFSERKSTLGGANPAYIKIGGYNVMVIAIIAALSSIIWRLIATKTNVPGLKEFASAA